ITSYKVTPYLEGRAQTAVTVGGEETTKTITGLTPGSSYTFTVSAANAVGQGPESPQSGAVTPAPVAPGAPGGVGVAAGNNAAEVTWTAPASNGGSPITGYRVTPYLGSEALAATSVGAEATRATVGSLTNGRSYTFRVAAVNAAGTGAESAASAAVVPRLTLLENSTPATIDVSDPGSVVVGMKFASSVAGQIRGIRFYKAAANTGTHVVGLWTSGGTLLAQATATEETATGWQEVNFSSPVQIAANTVYIAAYLAPKGHYSATTRGFASAVTNGTLTAPATTTTPNGVYVYSSSLAFPVSSFNASNYWVDVMFTP
ncbi:MAG TPA: DUF4082 domain-containing protein, partial [Solirubrobacterales bacterium]|nr:DUF4082 domain-containing protein [Solirubrobacterales bacterium]